MDNQAVHPVDEGSPAVLPNLYFNGAKANESAAIEEAAKHAGA